MAIKPSARGQAHLCQSGSILVKICHGTLHGGMIAEIHQIAFDAIGHQFPGSAFPAADHR
jgi:hypothetical protein